MLKKTSRSTSNKESLPLVIVNPKSASGATREKWAAIAADLRTHFGPFNVAFTKGPGEGMELARQACEAGRRFIIACGGDGTINEIANGVIASETDAELGIFPSGTGGDFRRTLGLPTTPRDIARALRDGETRRIDVGRVSFIDHHGNEATRHFLNVTSFGLAASIIERVKGSSSLDWLPLDTLRGRASFALSTLQEVVGMATTKVMVKLDDKPERQLSTVNFCIANARYFGGGMMIAPDAKLADGYLDVVNVGDINTAKIILNSYSLYLGTHTDLSEVGSIRAKRIEVRPAAEGEVHIEIDGELPGRLPATYEVLPGALRIRVPHR